MTQKLKPAIGFIFITILIDVAGFGIIIPVLPKLISEMIGGNMSQASIYGGWLMFAFSLMQFLFSPLMGNLSDKFGRRPILLFSLFGFAVDYLVLTFAPSIGWLFVGRIIAGIMGASFTTASAYIADISTPEKRAQNFGMIGAAFGLGFIIGPVIGGVLGQFGSRVPFMAAAGLTALNWLYGYFVLPESLKPENRREFEWKRANPVGAFLMLKRYPIIAGLAGCLTLIYIAGHAVQSTWPYFTIGTLHWSEAMVGYSLGFVGILFAVVQGGLIRVINPKLGDKGSVYTGIGLYVVALVLLAFADRSWMMFVYIIPYCLGAIGMTALQGIMSNAVPDNEQGELQGTMTSLMSATSIIGPPLMTNIFSYFTSVKAPVYFPGAAFLTGAVLTLFSVFFAVRSLSRFSYSTETIETRKL